jgi:glucose/arabinose dehydrogenase
MRYFFKMTKFILRSFIAIPLFALVLVGGSDEKDENLLVDLPPVGIKLDTLITGLNQPWGIELVDDKILITEKSGILYSWDGKELTRVNGLPQFVSLGQGGLLDVCKHPLFETNRLIYFCGSTGSLSAASTTLYRGKLNENELTEVEKLFQATPQNNSGAHFGSRIVFDNSGKVYLSLGDRGSMQTAQQLENHNGCVIRLNDDGSIPDDNPLVNTPNAKSEIWTYGHRNVQGMALNPITGDIWTHEHGPKGGDEVNILIKGANYGWPLASYGIDYNGDTITQDTFVAGTELPVHYWIPSIAPCGMSFYNADSIPQWKGNLFLGALAGKHVNRLVFSQNKVLEEQRLLQNMARFRAVKAGNDGYLYMVTEEPGMLLRFRPE